MNMRRINGHVIGRRQAKAGPSTAVVRILIKCTGTVHVVSERCIRVHPPFTVSTGGQKKQREAKGQRAYTLSHPHKTLTF